MSTTPNGDFALPWQLEGTPSEVAAMAATIEDARTIPTFEGRSEIEQLKAAIRWMREVGVIDDVSHRVLWRLADPKRPNEHAARVLAVLEEEPP